MIGQSKKMERAAGELEAAYRGAVSDFFVLVKGGLLSEEEKARLEARLESLLKELEAQCGGYNNKAK
jgi:argininosuccinate lyase